MVVGNFYMNVLNIFLMIDIGKYVIIVNVSVVVIYSVILYFL